MTAAAPLHGWRPERPVPRTYGRPEALNAPKADRRERAGFEPRTPGSCGGQRLLGSNSSQRPSSMQRGAVGALALLLPQWPPLLCVPGHPGGPQPPPRPRPRPSPRLQPPAHSHRGETPPSISTWLGGVGGGRQQPSFADPCSLQRLNGLYPRFLFREPQYLFLCPFLF